MHSGRAIFISFLKDRFYFLLAIIFYFLLLGGVFQSIESWGPSQITLSFVLFLLGVNLLLSYIKKESPGIKDELEMGLIIVLMLQLVIQATGSSRSFLYPLNYLLIAVMASYFSYYLCLLI